MLWKPRGVLDQSTVNEIVAFIEAVEKRSSKPLNRFNDLSALDAVDLNFDFVFHVALGRRLSAAPKPPVKSAFFVTSEATKHYAKLHAVLDRLFAAPRRFVHGSRCRGQVARRSARGIVRIWNRGYSASKPYPEIAPKSYGELHLAFRSFSRPKTISSLRAETILLMIMTRKLMKQTFRIIFMSCVAGFALPAFAAEQPITDVGTLDETSAKEAFPAKPPYSPYAGRNFPTRPFFGDTHVHTSFSMDAGAFGCRLGPTDAYRFAKGEEVTASSGQRARLARPLDFIVVTDHSDGFGFFPQLLGGNPEMLAYPQGGNGMT